jgi:broad specificity phosphatase PhoE
MSSRCCKTSLMLVASIMLLVQSDRSEAETSGTSGLPALLVLVRHAEFAPEPKGNPPLSPQGIKRAQELASVLKDTRFSAIITSQLLRTRETAQPIVTALGLTSEIVPLNPGQAKQYEQGVVAALRKHVGGSVLVVSHSRSGPAIITALGGPPVPAICESVHDDLFVLVSTAGKLQLIQSRYGEVSSTRGPNCK